MNGSAVLGEAREIRLEQGSIRYREVGRGSRFCSCTACSTTVSCGGRSFLVSRGVSVASCRIYRSADTRCPCGRRHMPDRDRESSRADRAARTHQLRCLRSLLSGALEALPLRGAFSRYALYRPAGVVVAGPSRGHPSIGHGWIWTGTATEARI